MIRTRTLIEQLSYPDLVTAGLIPDLFGILGLLPEVVSVKRYPPFVYHLNDTTSNFSFYGLVLDYIVRAGLRIHLEQPVDLGIDPVTELIPDLSDSQIEASLADLSTYETSINFNQVVHASHRLAELLFNTRSAFPESELQQHIPSLVNVLKALRSIWASYGTSLGGTVRFNYELVGGQISGHPDILTERAVLDIKTTGSFKTMASHSWLQVLIYYALAKPTHPELEMVGFVLPMQRTIALYGVSDWDSRPFLEFLFEKTRPVAAFTRALGSLNGVDPVLELYRTFPIGSHVAKGKNILLTLQDFIRQLPGRPAQMFLLKNRGKRSVKALTATEIQCMEARDLIQNLGLSFFIHAPYNINLCINESGDTGDDFWQQRYLNWDLAMGVLMGARGVVVHTGARKERPLEDALGTMEFMVRNALFYASESCPLLLETSAGEGSDVCTSPEELGEFFLRFTPEEQERLGVCVDTCHVFSCGYDPLAYLQHWETYCPVPIRLIHFNDSAGTLGCCHDRHSSIGKGHIGLLKMRQIAAWALARSIPMVKE